MESLRQIGAALLLGVVSVVILLGGFLLAMAEGGVTPAAQPASPTTAGSSGPIIVTIFPTLPLPVSAPSQSTTPYFTTTTEPTLSLTPPPTLTICPPPAGWVPIIVQPYHTLDGLSQIYRTSVDLLRTKNCLLNDQLVAGSLLYVPPLPTSTLVPCGPPPGWGSYTVVPGDTLYRISLLYRVTVPQLMQANCLRTSNISAGQVLRVPRVPTSTPAVPNTPLPTLTDAPTLTPIASPLGTEPAPTTELPSPTTVPATATATSLPTNTPAPSDTPVTPGP